ncbi:5d6e90a4-993f-4e89-ac35-7d7a8761ef99 [Thermothielavioides terrestris]|uniref:5d6e90a4-993f-4e89-ac35-7d7a8761ef99 n=1 Tax=Thermothielavioides terrestris TaxID=2587410 RepID=A0A3S4BIE3_9PEZI|nr:5d6e90a4-993f-4e89-ac35-7d7a8761ef99 [Thermothielavioides terrestris]
MEPASSNTGFFQEQPVLKNQWHDDVSLQRIARLFLPRPLLDQISPEVARLGDEVLSPQIFDWVADAERNQPYLRGGGRDAFGKPRSELVVTEGWRKLQDFGFQKGFVAVNYDSDYGPYNRLVQFIRCHLWEASCANTTCPAAMQDGAARLLQRHLADKTGLSAVERRVFQNAYDHLISRDPAKAWTSGQWMTERAGGSDVSQTETVATYDPYPASSPAPLADAAENIPLGPWSISGFKWFSSATDAQMTILLAKTDPAKGVSAFLAPMRRHNPAQGGGASELNGVTIQRLKQKLGTQSLPTAELELRGMRAWLIGQEGRGIHEISTILTITRVHTAVASVGYLGRMLAVARAYAAVRPAGLGRGRRVLLAAHPCTCAPSPPSPSTTTP